MSYDIIKEHLHILLYYYGYEGEYNMSRVEKHRKYREEAAASISSNQKSIDNFKRESTQGFRHEPSGGFNNMPTDNFSQDENPAFDQGPAKIEAIDFSKPIRRLNEDRLTSHGTRADSPFHDKTQVKENTVKPNINIDVLRERAKNHTANELFDIDEAFNQLKTEHASPEMDTQLEVMNNLFSDKLTEYNSTMQLQTPATGTRKVVIDEEKLMSLLDERERKLKQELLAKEKQQQKKVMAESEKELKEREKRERAEQARYEKEQARLEKEQAKMAKEMKNTNKESIPSAAPYEIQPAQMIKTKNPGTVKNALALSNGNDQWAVQTQSLQKRVKQHDYEFVNLEKNIRKNNIIILILIFILLGIFGYLVYTFVTA